MKKIESRTASILLTENEAQAIDKDHLRVIYRPISLHWDRQFTKFKEPKQSTLVGFEAQDIAHLMKDTGKIHTDDDGKESPVIVKVTSRVIRRIHDVAVFPKDYPIKHVDLEAGDPCWIVVLGHKIG